MFADFFQWLNDELSLTTGNHTIDGGDMVLRLAMAILLGALIGSERERSERAAGLRTHALVSVGSALFMLVSIYGFSGFTGDPGRISAQVVSGIGFLGAGVIIFKGNTVHGLTTAATIWCVAALGLASGAGMYAPATVATVFMLILQAGLKPLSRWLASQNDDFRLVVEVEHQRDVLADLEQILGEAKLKIETLDLERGEPGKTDTVDVALKTHDQEAVFASVGKLRALDHVRKVHYMHGKKAGLLTS